MLRLEPVLSEQTQSALEPREALRRAVQSLEAGAADPRTLDGAKVNALEAIAWSLIGILGDRVAADKAAPARSASESLSGGIRSVLGIEEPKP